MVVRALRSCGSKNESPYSLFAGRFRGDGLQRRSYSRPVPGLVLPVGGVAERHVDATLGAHGGLREREQELGQGEAEQERSGES